MKRIEMFNIRIVNTGDKYGVNDCLTNNKAPMIEFYDARFTHGADGARGQFVTRYYIETITDSGCPNGLCLDGGVPVWFVSAEGMKEVIEYIKEAQA
jgi:hypothetical protein